jgi:4'-phosphopantetheinyl transferase
MSAPGWLTRSLADVPAGDGWLRARERAALADLKTQRRATDWRLGRWAAKAALSAWSGASRREVEISTAAGGAPQALISGEPGRASVSLSHRNGRALVAVAEPRVAIGCDLEVVEPRSAAFLRTWFAPAERASLASAGETASSQLANAIWATKEAAAKARHEGLRLDPGHAVVEIDWEPSSDGEWRPLGVHWEREAITARGWWRQEAGWVFAIVSDPPTHAPAPL